MEPGAQPESPERSERPQPRPGIKGAQASVWKLTWQCYNWLVLAFLIGTVVSIPVIYHSVTARFKSYTELVYLVGNSPREEPRLVQWARASPGVDNFRCERHEGELWVRWEYRGSHQPEALRNAPEHLRALGYSFSGMRGIASGAVPRNTSEQVADVLSDPVALTAMLLGMQLSFGLIGWRRIRAVSREGQPLPPLFARNHGRAILTGLATGVALFGVGWLYTLGVKALFGATPPGPWDAVQTMPTSARMAVLLFGALGAPVAEEIFFRGYVFGMFKAANKAGYGIPISAALFAMAHFSDPYNVPAVFLFGLVLAWAFHRTRSLLTSIVAHALNNGLALGAFLLG